MSAGQALRHPYFKDLRDADKSLPENQSIGPNPAAMRLTHRGADSFSNQSKSMSKISDNVSESSYHHLESKKKAHQNQFRHTKQGYLGANSSVGGISDLKIEGGKTQTFHSDVEETYSNAGGGTVPSMGGNPALPPIFMPIKGKASKKKSSNSSNLAMFNATKKQFP